MTAEPTEPTEAMIRFYDERTHAHIARVQRCLRLLAAVTPYRDELLQRAETHDASKFTDAERVPYIWLTEYHRCRWRNIPFAYPDGMEQRVREAVKHHVHANRHHPEFHADPNDMTDVDLIEMVCDWTAMALEFDQDGGSARGWAEQTVGKKLHFNATKRSFIFATIALLDEQLQRDASSD